MSSQTVAADRGARRFARHSSDLFRLALPVILSRAGMVLMGTVDAVIVGHHSANELAQYGLGHMPSNMLYGTIIGLLMGTVALTAHALGAGHDKACGEVFRNAVPYGLLIGFAIAVLCLFGETLFTLTGQTAELASGGAEVLAILGLGFPGVALSVAAGSFLDGLKRPLPGFFIMVFGNLANALLCWMLVWGVAGLPELGAIGSAWATTIVRTVMGLATLAWVWWMPDHARWGVRDGFAGWWRRGGDLRHFGYATGASFTIESAAFSGLGLMAGALSSMAMAAYTIILNLLAVPFMAAAGIATATAVRVGVGYGQRSPSEMAMAGWMGLGFAMILLAPASAFYFLMPETAARIYSTEAELLVVVAPVVALSGWILFVDGAQVVMANALRGRNDRWIPTVLHFISYGAVMLPVCAVLAFSAGHGLQGLAEGILIASVVSAGVLTARFAWLCREREAA
jgi:multidrug resistance protein, MATE family